MSRIVFACLLLASTAAAQLVPGRFIVELADEPAASKNKAAVRSNQARVSANLSARGFSVVNTVENTVSAVIVRGPDQDPADLESIPGVRRVHPVRLCRMYLDHAAVLQKVVDAWSAIGGPSNAGKGVRIGIIDSGVDSMHPGLQDPDLVPPPGFPKVTNSADLANTNNKVIVARTYEGRSARDTEGHGTGVAMIAAGRTVTGPRGVIAGVAPKAFLGNYRVFPDGEDGAPTDSILRAIDDAVADGMDVINLSLGSFPTEDPSRDILVRAVDRASAAGIIVVVAAGNEGPGVATIGSPGTASSAITVGSSGNDRVFASSVKAEGAEPWVALPASGSGSREAVTAEVADLSTLDGDGLACRELPSGSLQGRLALILRGTCYFEDKLRNAERAGAIAAVVYTNSEQPDAITMGVGAAALPAVMLSYANGSALRELVRGGAVTGTVTFTPSPMAADPSRLSAFSSKGPSVDAGLKPDVLAVGGSVYTASSSTNNSPGFQVTSGTSFSAPMVAGAAALLKSARPGLSVGHYRSLLLNSAAPFGSATVQQAGSGVLDVATSLRSTTAFSPPAVNLGAGSGTIDQVVQIQVTNLGTTADTYGITVQSKDNRILPVVSDSILSVAAGRSETVRLQVAAAGLPPGEYEGFVIARSAATGTELRLPWWYAVPSGEVVSITALAPNATDASAGSTQQIYVRPTDAAGLPVDIEPSATVVDGGGRVMRVDRSSAYPGFFVVRVRLGAGPGANVFTIEAGAITTQVTIDAE